MSKPNLDLRGLIPAPVTPFTTALWGTGLPKYRKRAKATTAVVARPAATATRPAGGSRRQKGAAARAVS